MNLPLLVVESLRVSIGVNSILENVSLEVAAGEIVGVVGASGSGKSVTALAILGLLPAHARVSGTVRLDGVDLTQQSERELQRVRGRDLGMIFQEPMMALNPLLCIGDQVAETALLHRTISRRTANSLARAALDEVGLREPDGALERYPHQLSGGQRQRVAIAIAIVLRPSLLIADEPTTALDVIAQAGVLRLLQGLAHGRGMGLMLVSHDLAVISQYADRVLVMQAGSIVDEGSPRSLGQLRNPYARALLAAAQPAVRAADAAMRGAEPREGAEPVLEVRGLVREYPVARRGWRTVVPRRAVDGASLVLHAGENVGLVGESGSGKSTLLRAILALDRPAAGEVRVLGTAFSSAVGAPLRRLRRSIQAVFQDPFGSFDPLWSVERVIAEPFYLLDAPPGFPERRRRVAAVLAQVGLRAADAARHPNEFSGGERQRIAIARALITEPAVIVFDEAVSALDVLIRAQILRLLADLSTRSKLAYLFVSHDLNVVRAIADRVYVMQRGRIVESGATERVFGAPQTDYLRELLAATPRLHPPST